MASSQTASHAPHESEATITSSNERPLKSNCVHDELLPRRHDDPFPFLQAGVDDAQPDCCNRLGILRWSA